MSSTSGPAESISSRARVASTSSISDLTCWSSSRYVAIAFRNIAIRGLAIVGAMTPRVRVFIVVAAAAVALAAVAVGVTLATRTDVPASRAKPPPLAQDATASPAVRREVRAALGAWPAGTVRRLRILVEQHPRSALVRLELGVALAFSGQDAEAEAAWRAGGRGPPG